MAAKPETQATGNINKALVAADSEVYAEKTHNPYRGGIPDFYYDYPGHDLWVEYKFLERLPPQLCLRGGSKPPVSQLQERWINRGARNGRQVLVIVAIGKGKTQRYLVIRPFEPIWTHSIRREELEPRLIDRDRLIEFLLTVLRYGGLAQTY